jgi:hypothetical protein
MDDLIAFVRASLGELERAAQAATTGPWRYDPTKWNAIDHEESVFTGPDGPHATTVASTGPGDDPQSMADAWHIALHDPAAVLASVKADRAILGAATTALDRGLQEFALGERLTGEAVVMALAQKFAGRPGWRPEWAA